MAFKGKGITRNGITMTISCPSKLALRLLLIVVVFSSSSLVNAKNSKWTGKSRTKHGRMKLPKASYDRKEQGSSERSKLFFSGDDCEKKYDDALHDNEPMWWSILFSTFFSTFLPPEAIKAFSSVSSNLIPAIPEQDDESLAIEIMQPKTYTNIGNHFRLEFILNEFLLGFKYMWRIIPALLVYHVLQDIFCYQLRVDDDVAVEWPHRLFPTDTFNILTILFCGDEPSAWHDSMRSILWVPVLEELIYRGFGMLLYQAEFMIRLAMFAMLCRELNFLPWLMLPVSNMYFYAKTLHSHGFFSYETLPCWGYFLLSTVETALLGRVFCMIWNLRTPYPFPMKLKESTRGGNKSEADKAEDMTEGKNEAYSDKPERNVKLKEWFPGQLLSLVSNNAPSPRFQRLVSKSALLWAIIRTSFEFAVGHIPSEILSQKRLVWFILKGFRVFIVSILVFSRLSVKRGNIWAAVGAHSAANVFSLFYDLFRSAHSAANVFNLFYDLLRSDE